MNGELEISVVEARYNQLEIKRQKTLNAQQKAWRLNPLLWLEERLGEDPKSFRWSDFPEYESNGHDWDGDKDPLVRAWFDLANKVRLVGIESGTGTGKTYWLARVVLWFLDVYPNSLVVTSAPKQSQLKLNLWAEIGQIYPKLKKYRPQSELLQLRLKMVGRGVDEDERQQENSWHAVGFVAGVGAGEDSAGKARGFHREDMLLILEECTGMPLAVLNAFKNTATASNNLILGVGNPDNQFDPLHVLCSLPSCSNYRISGLDHPNIVLEREVFPGCVSQASIADRVEEFGEESLMYDRMVRGISPDQSSHALIKREWIDQCVDLDLGPLNNAPNSVGVDVANSETGDKAALSWMEGRTLVEVQEFQCPDATALGYNLFMDDGYLASKGFHNFHTRKIYEMGISAPYIGVDATGVGVATVNILHHNGYKKILPIQGGIWEEAIPLDHEKKPMYRFAGLRDQMWWELREDLRRRRISIKVKDKTMLDQIYQELLIVTYSDEGNYIQIESKKDLKKRMGGKSPNVGDAVVYNNWTSKGYRVNTGGKPISAGA